MKRLALVVSALPTVVPLAARAEPVLLISIDGLRPGDVLLTQGAGNIGAVAQQLANQDWT